MKRIRFGNHPVRQQELQCEFGAAGLVALFPERVLRKSLPAFSITGHAFGKTRGERECQSRPRSPLRPSSLRS